MQRLTRFEAATDLSHRGLEDGDMSALCEALANNTTVTSLDLSHNRLTDASVDALLEILPTAEAFMPERVRRPNVRLRVVRLAEQRPPAAYECNLVEGDRVEARCRSGRGKPLGTFFPAVVVSVPTTVGMVPKAVDCSARSRTGDGSGSSEADYGGFGGESGGYMVEFEDGERAANLPRCFIRKGQEYDIGDEKLRELDASLQFNADYTPIGLSDGKLPDGKTARELGWPGVPCLRGKWTCEVHGRLDGIHEA